MNSILSLKRIQKELEWYNMNLDAASFVEAADELLEDVDIQGEDKYDKMTENLKLDILDIERFVKVNELQAVTDPRAFSYNSIPSDNGLLSNKIFGYTMEERAGTYAYIDLHGWFLDPSCYKTWCRLDSAIKNIVHGVKYYRFNEETGQFIPDEENGKTGIDFLRKCLPKVVFKPKNEKSNSKKISAKYLDANRNRMFISKYPVIPPFYRDKNTVNSKGGSVGLGGINKIYNNLIIASNAITSTQDYMFDATDAMKARVQETILNIYDWFAGNSNKAIDNDRGVGMSGKIGILRRTNMSKTANFSARVVITSPELKVERMEDMMANFDHSAVPLYVLMTNFRDFVMFHVRRFFENEFQGAETYPVINKKGEVQYLVPKDPEIEFSDERIKQELDRFLHGYNNRFIPIQVPMRDTDEKYYMAFKGIGNDPRSVGNLDNNSKYKRRFTWCDVFYIATVEATRDKQVLITRFPIDFYTNQITTGIVVSSTKDTEPIDINGEHYEYYPRIREEMIGTDTSNLFVDTVRMSNAYLSGMGGDYDGDQITCKGVYTEEANAELKQYMNSKQNFITFGCQPSRTPGSDCIQSFYCLTKVLSDTKITPTESISYS